MNRRTFLRSGAAAAACSLFSNDAFAAYDKVRIGVTDWNLQRAAKPTSLELAKEIGFDGVEISLGRAPDRLPLSEPDLQEKFLEEARSRKFPIASTCLDILHQNYLKNDPLAKRWVRESIPLTKKLGAKVILLPFFGKGALTSREEMNHVGDFLKEVGPEAQKAGVILGIEDTISAEDNARILDRAQSPAVLVYYDVGNSQRNGFDILKEIRWLGKDRICEFHLKDNPRLMGQGLIDFPKVVDAIVEIGFTGWAHLETEAPSGNVRVDMKKNLEFIRGLFARH